MALDIKGTVRTFLTAFQRMDRKRTTTLQAPYVGHVHYINNVVCAFGSYFVSYYFDLKHHCPIKTSFSVLIADALVTTRDPTISSWLASGTLCSLLQGCEETACGLTITCEHTADCAHPRNTILRHLYSRESFCHKTSCTNLPLSCERSCQFIGFVILIWVVF